MHPLYGFDALLVLVQRHFLDTHGDAGMQFGLTVVVGAARLGHVGEHHAFALGIDLLASHVIQAEHDVLRRHDDRLAVSGRQHVVRSQHQGAGFGLGFQRQRHVDRHLVAVEVGVERRANQRMQLDRLALDQHRLERLDTQTVQRRCTVQHHRVLADDLFQQIPDDRLFVFHHLLGGLDRGRQPQHLEAVEDEGFEQLERHLLWQTALVQFQRRAHHDY